MADSAGNTMTTESSNTTQKQGGVTGKGFQKGDPRINRNGRPKSFDAARALAQQIAHEVAKSGKDGSDVVIDGHRATITEMILRQWATSKDARLQMAFMEWAYGKPPQPVHHSGADGGPLTVHVVYDGAGDDGGRDDGQ